MMWTCTEEQVPGDWSILSRRVEAADVGKELGRTSLPELIPQAAGGQYAVVGWQGIQRYILRERLQTIDKGDVI